MIGRQICTSYMKTVLWSPEACKDNSFFRIVLLSSLRAVLDIESFRVRSRLFDEQYFLLQCGRIVFSLPSSLNFLQEILWWPNFSFELSDSLTAVVLDGLSSSLNSFFNKRLLAFSSCLFSMLCLQGFNWIIYFVEFLHQYWHYFIRQCLD